MFGGGAAGANSDVGLDVPGGGGGAAEAMCSVPIKLSNNNTVIVGAGGLISAASGGDSYFGSYKVCGAPTLQSGGVPNFPNPDTRGGGCWYGGNPDHPHLYGWQNAIGYEIGYEDSVSYYSGSSPGPWAVGESVQSFPGGGSGGYLIGGTGDAGDDNAFEPGTGGGTQILGGAGSVATSVDSPPDASITSGAGAGGGGGGIWNSAPLDPGNGSNGYDGYVAIMWIEP